MASVETQVLAALLSDVILRRETHTAAVIVGIEHRCRLFGRTVPTEQEIRDAIAALVASGRITENEQGWLRCVFPAGGA